MFRRSYRIRTAGSSCALPQGLLAAHSTRRLIARARRTGTPGLIAPGPGLCVPKLDQRHWRFSAGAGNADAAQFAANLLRVGVADPEQWRATRDIGRFLQRTLQEFIGARASIIDSAFDVSVSMGTNPSAWHASA